MSSKKRTAGIHMIDSLEKEHKKTCSRNREVVIVIGGVEFLEYEANLRCWSSKFDKAIDSGMKESKSLRFEFPHRDPKEWELIVELVAPLATTKVNKDNVYVALSWFDELCSDRGLAECDRVLATDVIKDFGGGFNGQVDKLFDAFDLSLKHCLPHSKAECLKTIRLLFKKPHDWLHGIVLGRLCSHLKEDKECCDDIWEIFHSCLSVPSLTEKQKAGLQELDLVCTLVRPWFDKKMHRY